MPDERQHTADDPADAAALAESVSEVNDECSCPLFDRLSSWYCPTHGGVYRNSPVAPPDSHEALAAEMRETLAHVEALVTQIKRQIILDEDPSGIGILARDGVGR